LVCQLQFTENRPGCAPKPATGAIYLSASSVGGPPFPAYFPQSGLISLTVVGREGNAVETSIIGREGALGLHGAFGKATVLTRATTRFSTMGAKRFDAVEFVFKIAHLACNH
jgi:hypothetical protein